MYCTARYISHCRTIRANPSGPRVALGQPRPELRAVGRRSNIDDGEDHTGLMLNQGIDGMPLQMFDSLRAILGLGKVLSCDVSVEAGGWH